MNLKFLESVCETTGNPYRFSEQDRLNRYEKGWDYYTLFGPTSKEELEYMTYLAKKYESWLITYLPR